MSTTEVDANNPRNVLPAQRLLREGGLCSVFWRLPSGRPVLCALPTDEPHDHYVTADDVDLAALPDWVLAVLYRVCEESDESPICRRHEDPGEHDEGCDACAYDALLRTVPMRAVSRAYNWHRRRVMAAGAGR